MPRPLVVPGAEHRLDRMEQLLHRILRERLACEGEREFQGLLADRLERRTVELARACKSLRRAVTLHEGVELKRIGAVHDLGEISHQTPVAIAHLPRVA